MILAALWAAASFASAAQVPWKTAFDGALADSRRENKPVFAAFEAPWCYSCYYMQNHVLSGDVFARASAQVEPVMLDVDTEKGGALKQRYAVTFLPTFLLVDGDGKELGRIVGEQTEADFLAKLSDLLKQAPASNEDKRLKALRARVKTNPAALEELLKSSASCDTPEDVEQAADAVKKLPEKRRLKIVQAEVSSLEALSAKKLFVPAAERCADWRTGVLALSDAYALSGRDAGAKAALAKAAALLEGDGVAVGEDRNHDDNTRLFLEKLGDDAKILAFYDKLLAAYPADYVYHYRLGRYLKEHGRAAEALPHAEKAEGLAYGDNRLHVVELHAQILSELGRGADAKKLLDLNAKAAARFSSEKADYLKKLEKSLPSRS